MLASSNIRSRTYTNEISDRRKTWRIYYETMEGIEKIFKGNRRTTLDETLDLLHECHGRVGNIFGWE